MLDWDDLRPILAVARGGTLAAAAKGLRIDATTVGRRIQAAETALGVRLFDRIDGRYTATAAGELAISHGEAIEREVLALEGQVAGQDQSPEVTRTLPSRDWSWPATCPSKARTSRSMASP